MTAKMDIVRYIDNAVKTIKDTLPYVLAEMCECEDPDKTERWWREWAINFNKSEYEKAFGALLYAHCYENSINDQTYDFLLNEVYDAYRAEDTRIWETLR